MQLADVAKAAPTKLELETSSKLTFRMARPEDAEQVVSSYEQVFGKGGVRAPGHEAYPAPDVFSVQGIMRILADTKRQLIVADVAGRIAGAMTVNWLSPFNCEFACVSVNPAYQGLGISPRMLAFARQIADQSGLTINSTEIVTHSVLSQTAHHRVGYGKVSGFGFCQYPKVFFKNNPESCLWISEIQGKVADSLRSSRLTGAPSAPTNKIELDLQEQILLAELSKPREIFVPDSYKAIVGDILRQFIDVIDYRLGHENTAFDLVQGEEMSKIDWADGEPYAYLKLPNDFYAGWENDIDIQIEAIKASDKRYIQAKIPANHRSAIKFAEHLQKRGFVLLGFLPLYQYHAHPEVSFDDLLVLQWVQPEILEQNPLPGETDSVVKLYGFPANLTGCLLKVIRREFQALC